MLRGWLRVAFDCCREAEVPQFNDTLRFQRRGREIDFMFHLGANCLYLQDARADRVK